MADDLKILGKTGDASTEVLLYTVPADHHTAVSSIVVCNRGSTDRTFDIACLDGGGSTANEDYDYKDHPILANDTFVITIGITLSTGDTIRVTGSHSDLTFKAYGDEISTA